MREAGTAAPPPDGPTLPRRVWAVALVVGVVAAVLWPVVRQPPRDSFPLSTYPMFSFRREAVVDIDLVVGVAGGADVRLDPEVIAATDEVIQAGALVRRAVAAGEGGTRALCATVAERAGRSGVGADRIEVRTDRYDAIAWFRGGREPMASTLRATCPVPR